jgi:putative flavoprotein involved in K+ transport
MHDRGVVATEPGLSFVGLPFLFALISSFVGGVGRDAEYIAEHIVTRSPQRDFNDQKRAKPRVSTFERVFDH